MIQIMEIHFHGNGAVDYGLTFARGASEGDFASPVLAQHAADAKEADAWRVVRATKKGRYEEWCPYKEEWVWL